MGNCFKSPENNNVRKTSSSTETKLENTNENPVGDHRAPDGDGGQSTAAQDMKHSQDQNGILPFQTSSSNATMSNVKEDPSWLRILSQRKPEREQNNDNEDDCSIFGDNWDPELFEQRLQTPSPPVHSDSIDQARISKMSVEPWKNWNSDDSIAARSYRKGSKLTMVCSSLLGFSQYPFESSDNFEWFRNGELESPQPDANSFLIKSKKHQNEAEFDLDPIPSSKDTSLLHEGWIRYTMFLHQDKSDLHYFYSRFRNAKHIFMSLENKTGCELRISKQIFSYRGKLVRTFVIDGPSRKHIIRCYTSLPAALVRLLICECERPSLVEARPKSRCQEMGLSVPTILQRQICV